MAPAADEMKLRDEDRLPWLETVEESYEDGAPMGRVILLVLVGLGIIAAAIGGLYWYQDRPSTGGGTGELIAAPQGDYKIKPDEPGGMQVAGEGDSVFKTSGGGETSNASVDLSAVPEAPVAGERRPMPQPSATPAAGVAHVRADVPEASGRLDASKTATGAKLPVAAANGAGGAIVQLGSFPTAGSANTAWKQLSGRFGYLAGLGQSVQAADVNGRTVHRLRVNTGSNGQAREICGKLKVAGEACFVVAN